MMIKFMILKLFIIEGTLHCDEDVK